MIVVDFAEGMMFFRFLPLLFVFSWLPWIAPLHAYNPPLAVIVTIAFPVFDYTITFSLFFILKVQWVRPS